MSDSVVIIGGGLAAAQVAIQLRQMRWPGAITMLSAEPDPPYWKPPLSKSILEGTEDAGSAWIRPAEFWARRRIDLRLNAQAARLEPDQKTIITANGDRLAYGHAVLATGAYCIVPPLAGLTLPGVHVLRSLRDALALRDAAGPGTRVAILGGGFIGLEAASALTARGAAVTIIEREPRLLARVAAPRTSAFMLALHRSRGVSVCLGQGAARAGGDDRVACVYLEDGQQIGCDILLVCAGIRPETQLATAAGLECQDGVLVDSSLRSSNRAILALGDCARFLSARYGRTLRLESIQNAIDGAAAVAASISEGRAHYDPLPMISSVQLGHQLDFIGLADGADESRVTQDGDRFLLLHGKSGICVAAECVNAAPDIMALLRRAIETGERLDHIWKHCELQFAADLTRDIVFPARRPYSPLHDPPRRDSDRY
jgi:3-phenylpropionate/trans-cinnamate dioxygenase ferredoxin reductase subunit